MKQKPLMLFPVLHSGLWPPESLGVECSHIEEVKLSTGFDIAMERLVRSIWSKLGEASLPEIARPRPRKASSGNHVVADVWPNWGGGVTGGLARPAAGLGQAPQDGGKNRR